MAPLNNPVMAEDEDKEGFERRELAREEVADDEEEDE